MNNTFNIEDIKNEITRWATVKTPTLYQHFSVYLGIPTKEVKQVFLASKDIQDHIDKYFQEERKQETIERNERFEKDQSFLAAFISEAVSNGKLVTTEKIAKEHGIIRCNIKAFANANPELWEQATGIESQQKRARLKAERKAVTEAEAIRRKEEKERQQEIYVESLRLKAQRRSQHEARVLANAERKRIKQECRLEKILNSKTDSVCSDVKEIRKQYKAKLREAKRQEQEAKDAALREQENKKKYYEDLSALPFTSYAFCGYAYKQGRLVKKIDFRIALSELKRIGYIGHLNMFQDGEGCFGIYVQDHDHIGKFPDATGNVYHTFSFTWNKRMCKEPRTNKMVPLNFKLVETENRNGLCFQLPEQFYLDYMYD